MVKAAFRVTSYDFACRSLDIGQVEIVEERFILFVVLPLETDRHRRREPLDVLKIVRDQHSPIVKNSVFCIAQVVVWTTRYETHFIARLVDVL
jgi:hypothetical protein